MIPDEVLMDLWTAALGRKAPPFSRELGLCAFWVNDPCRYGSPLGPEREAAGATYQVFSAAILRWTPGVGVEQVA